MTTRPTSANSRTLALDVDTSKPNEGALGLLSESAHSSGYTAELDASSTSLALDVPPSHIASSHTISSNNQLSKRQPNLKAMPSGVSAVYRWYEVEEGFEAKKREESSTARCKLCKTQGKLDRKACVRFGKSVTSNLWRHLKENHPDVYEKHAGEKKSVQMHRITGLKKRGRKKKVVATSYVSSASQADTPMLSIEHEAHNMQTLPEEGTAMPTSVKKVKRGEHYTAHLFLDSPVGQHRQETARPQIAIPSGSTAEASGTVPTGAYNPEKVRKAIGYLCLYEMLPFELCSSHAFRNLMVECSGGGGSYVNGFNVMALITKDIASEYATKLAAEVQMRTLMEMKRTDFSHLMISEWRSSSNQTNDGTSAITSLAPSDSDCVFFAFFAVGLDPEFNSFRRCVHVSSIGNYRPGQANSIGAMLAGDKNLRKAMECIGPNKRMPQILAVEPSCSQYESFLLNHKLHCVESIPTVLQHIMLATIHGINISGTYGRAGATFGNSAVYRAFGFLNRRLDKGEYVESSLPADGVSSVSAAEMSSSILEELPTSLTGHTYRDVMNKLMYLLAHFKQSARSREVLRTLALDQCGMSAAFFERVFIERLRRLVISIDQIYSMLTLARDMMLALQAYFLMHKDRESDFSKLIQLSSFSRYEWSRVRYLTVILKPIVEATAKLESERYVISSLIVPSVFTLLEKLREPYPVNSGLTSDNDRATRTETMESCLPEDIEALRNLAFSNMSTYFGYLFSVPKASWGMDKLQTFRLLWCATILDPRTRSFIVKGSLPQEEYWEIVQAEAANMVVETNKKDQERETELGESSLTLEETDGEKSTDLWDDLQAKLASCAQEQMLLNATKSSVEATKASNLLELEVSFFQEEGRIVLRANPFEWWQTMRLKYPLLARLARYVLSIPCKVTVANNPVWCDGGLVKRGLSQFKMVDLCHLLAASMNLRTEKHEPVETATRKQIWTTA